MPVSGVKEKLLAAHRAGISEVLVPEQNRRDLEDVPVDIRNDLKKITLVARVDEILPIVLKAPVASAAIASGQRTRPTTCRPPVAARPRRPGPSPL